MAEKLRLYYQDADGNIKVSKKNYPTSEDETLVGLVTDNLLEGNYFKTINGQSIIGEGDIHIGGGGDITINVNGESYTSTDGQVTLPDYPSSVSELANDAGFTTGDDVDDKIEDALVDIHDALDDRYTKEEVDELIGDIESIKMVIVAELPAEGESNIIYLVPQAHSADDTYDEFVYISGNWERIGSTDISLDDYYTKEEVDEIIDDLQSSISELSGGMEAIEASIESIEGDVASKSSVSVSATGTATDRVKYITVDGTEKRLSGSDIAVNDEPSTTVADLAWLTVDGVTYKVSTATDEVTEKTNETNVVRSLTTASNLVCSNSAITNLDLTFVAPTKDPNNYASSVTFLTSGSAVPTLNFTFPSGTNVMYFYNGIRQATRPTLHNEYIYKLGIFYDGLYWSVYYKEIPINVV